MEPLIVTRSARLASGECRHAIDADIRSGRVLVPFRGVHVGAASMTLTTRFRAAVLAQRGQAVVSHRSAAVAHQQPWLPDDWSHDDACVELTLPPGIRRRQRQGLRLRWSDVDQSEQTVVSGLPVTTHSRTLLDLIRDQVVGPMLGVTLIDGALGNDLLGLPDLHMALERLTGRHGVDLARRAVDSARAGVDSPQETKCRLTLILHGVTPELIVVGQRIVDGDGLLLARGDFGHPASMLWCEFDGYDVHSKRAAFAADRRRDRWLEGRGWSVLRFSNDDFRDPAGMARDYLARVHAAPARILAMDPRRSAELTQARAAVMARQR